MIAHFHNLLEGIVAQPDQRIADLPLLTDAEQHELLCTRNQTESAYPADKCFHELFEAQVARTPTAIAVEYAGKGGGCLTYHELNRRANQLAHHLHKLGIGPGKCVGICMERAPELLVGLLAIFKAGAAFLPLDRAFPSERLAFMLADAQVSLLLTQRRVIENIPVEGVKVLCLDAIGEVLAQESDEQPVCSITAEHLAYIIYTSGSTGKPKGVMIPHRGFTNYLAWCVDAYGAAAGCGAPVQSSIAADAIFPGLFAPLLTGTRVVLLPESQALEALSTTLQAQRDFSLVKITPSQLEVLNQQLPQVDAGGWVRTLVVGAEALRRDILEFWQKHAPGTILLNEYGPTETVVGCSIYQVSPGQVSAGVVPIGLPIANTQFYVLNSHLQPVPVGVAGELYIGGDGVAWGYLNRPELTAATFIPDPFSARPGARLYKTGDLVRYLPDRDANIEFLGRIDQQVKIRGYRVELGEVEATLAEHRAVDQVVVMARENVSGIKQLVAYVIVRPAERTSGSELRSFLEQKLPGYMVPSALVFLDKLPLKATGKVDLSALPAPERTHPEREETFAPPLTLVEKQLAEIWCEVLGLEQIGIHDNFFEVGGDSILSIRIIARAQAVGIRITPKEMFQYQTIADLAAIAGIATALTPMDEEISGTSIVPLTPVQHWFFEHDFPDRHHYNHATLLEMAPDVIDAELVREAIQAVMQQHDVLRLRYTEEPMGWQQSIVANSEMAPFTFIDLALYPEMEQERRFEEETARVQTSLDLAQGPLARVVLFYFGQHKPGRLLIVVHHLAIDIVSWQILLGDLQTAYQQLLNGQKIRLPRKTTSFKTWAERLFDYAQSLRQEASYWMALPWAEVKHLPMEKNGENTQASARAVLVALNSDETQALLREVPKRYRTQANDVLLAALQQAFAAWTGTQTLLVDLEGHGREDIVEEVDLSHTIGWFTSIVPVLLHLDKMDSEPGETLKAVKEHLRGIPNGGIGFGLLRYLHSDSEITEHLRTLPLAEVIFNYQGRSARALSEDTLFTPSQASSGLPVSLRGIRSHLLSINAGVVDGELYVEWTYSENVHHRSTIERLADLYLEALRSIIRHCRLADAGGYTPSDFPEAGLSQNELDSLIARLDY
jgi:amino acid adenylation domain-containing protein/non-ribosomal peptide synthase protein (TIGR01720 family)